MNENTIKPEKITKPIQLLGAWLAGLFSINASFLITAIYLNTGSWEPKALIIASIVNVPLFLMAVFLLQTRFRPELQEDSFYSTYLSNKTNQVIILPNEESKLSAINLRISQLEQNIKNPDQSESLSDNTLQDLTYGINKFFSDKESILNFLVKQNIYKITSFGGFEPPNTRNVSISKHLSKNEVVGIIKIAKQIGFESYNLFDKYEENTNEDVLLGSYGEGSFLLKSFPDNDGK